MKRSAEPTIRTTVPGDLYVKGDNVRLELTWPAAASGRRRAHVGKRRAVLNVLASDGTVVAKRRSSGKAKQTVNLGPLPLDCYTARLLDNGEQIALRTFGVVPRRRFKSEGEPGVAAKVGLRFAGCGLCFDGVLTGKPGEMNWKDNRRMADGRGNWFSQTGPHKNYEDVARAAAKSGLEVLGSVDLKSGNWEIGNVGTMRLVPIYEHLDEVGPCVYEYVKRCRIKYLIVWNEPDFYWNLGEAPTPDIWAKGHWHGRFVKAMPVQEYVNLLRTCYEAAKKADPKCQVVLGGALHLGQFTEDVYRFGGRDYFDIVGFHYFSGNSIHDFGEQVKSLREIMARYGDDKPIWDTEFGCGGAQPWDAITGGSLFTAAFETKYVALSTMYNTVPCGHFMSLSSPQGAPPHAVAFALATWLLDRATFKKRLDFGHDDAGLLFRRRNGKMCGTFWAEKHLRAVVKTDADTVTVRHILGPTHRVKTDSGCLSLQLNAVPVILEGFEKLELVEGPYDSTDYRVIENITPVETSQVTGDVPCAFPKVRNGAIKVDGSLADWKEIPTICTPEESQRVQALPVEDYYKFDKYQYCMGEARVAYDADSLYICAKVRKDKDAQIDPKVANVMFSLRAFDSGVQWGRFCKGQSLVALMSRPGGETNVVRVQAYDMAMRDGDIPGARIKTRNLAKDLVFEASIPWKALRPIRPEPGKIVELAMSFGGDDGNDYYWWFRLLATHWFVRPPAVRVQLKF